MILSHVMLFAGLVLLFAGGEFLVRGSVALATRLRLSPFVIGLTVVGFGTSMPELLVSLAAVLQDDPDISVGNVVGSNIANILLILGMAALISPVTADFSKVHRDLGVMVLVSIGLYGITFGGELGRLGGFFMVGTLALYLFRLVRHAPNQDAPNQDTPELDLKPPGMAAAMATVAGSLAALILGAKWMVGSSVELARQFGVSEAVIGLTIVAVGTSLPELATSVMAALRRKNDIAIGNVIGSNIFNILGILGVTSLVSPLAIDPDIIRFDIPVMVAVAILLMVLVWQFHRLGRWIGAGFLLAYGAYVVSLY